MRIAAILAAITGSLWGSGLAIKRRKKSATNDSGTQIARSMFDLMARVIDRFGWPGGTVILVFIFVEVHGTPSQKHEIIDMLIHPDSPGGRAIALLVLLTSGIFVAQHHYWKRKMKTMQKEIDRLAEWKTQHQQERIPVDLYHTQSTVAKAAKMAPVRKG